MISRRSIFTAAFWAAFFMPRRARAHSWYGDREDPKLHMPCCGEHDCDVFPFVLGETLFPTEEGYRVVLSVEQCRGINKDATQPIDTIVEWARIQQSEDGRWHICIAAEYRKAPHFGVYCLFEPASI